MGVDLGTLMNEAIDTMRAVHKAAKGLQALSAEQRELVKLSVQEILAQDTASTLAAMRGQAREPLPAISTAPGRIMGTHPLMRAFIDAVNTVSNKWKNQPEYYEQAIAKDLVAAWQALVGSGNTLAKSIAKELAAQEAGE